MRAVPSASQTVGPFFRIGLEHLCASDAPAEHGALHTVTIRGRVLDGEGTPVPDAVLEIWHSDGAGRYSDAEPDERGRPGCFTRAATDDRGCFAFSIAKPGVVECDGVPRQAPHIAVLVFARGLMRHLMTRMYFPGEAANESDPLLCLVPTERLDTLVAREASDGSGALEWNVVLQGDGETVFFAW